MLLSESSSPIISRQQLITVTKMSDFAPMIDYFRKDLRCLPAASGVPMRAAEIAAEMAAVWRAAGYTHEKMEKEFLDNPQYPLETDHPMVKAGKGISEMLLGSEDL